MSDVLAAHAAKATISTAVATWWLVGVTTAAAIVTLLAVGAAFLVPFLDRKAHRDERREDQERRKTAAEAEMRGSQALLTTLQTDLAKGMSGAAGVIDLNPFWSFVNRLEVARRLHNYRLQTDMGDEAVPIRILRLLQAIYEARDACLKLLEAKDDPRPPNVRVAVAGRKVDVALRRLADHGLDS